jgi:hypothetical protein
MAGGTWATRPSQRQTLDHNHLAEVASQTLGIPGRQAQRLAERYLRRHSKVGPPTSFLTWICEPSLSQTN